MERKAKIGLTLAGAAGATALSVVGLSDYILRCAVDREQPASLRYLMRLMQGIKPKDDPYAGLEPGWQRLKNMPHETVTVTAHDGVTLTGHWFEVPEAERLCPEQTL